MLGSPNHVTLVDIIRRMSPAERAEFRRSGCVAWAPSVRFYPLELILHTSPTKRRSDFVAYLKQIDVLYGSMPGRAGKPVVLVKDHGLVHVSKVSRSAIAARAHRLTVKWPPKYTPDLNDWPSQYALPSCEATSSVTGCRIHVTKSPRPVRKPESSS